MARKVKEWIGSSDDAKVPAHVKLRIFERENGICWLSGRKIGPADQWDLDHKIALCNGGEHRESNLFPALRDKHREKTKLDVAERAETRSWKSRQIGIKKPKYQWPKRSMSRNYVSNTKQLDEDFTEESSRG